MHRSPPPCPVLLALHPAAQHQLRGTTTWLRPRLTATGGERAGREAPASVWMGVRHHSWRITVAPLLLCCHSRKWGSTSGRRLAGLDPVDALRRRRAL